MNKFFYHYIDTQRRTEVVNMRIELGWEGYGLYVAVLELLAGAEEYRLPTKFASVAFNLVSTEEMVRRIVCDYGLFDFSDDMEWFYSSAISRQMEHVDSISRRARTAANKRWGSGADGSATKQKTKRKKAVSKMQNDAENSSSTCESTLATSAPNPDPNSDAMQSQCGGINLAMQMQCAGNANKIKQNNTIQNNIKEKKEETAATPVPPQGGLAMENDKRSVNLAARNLFEEHYRATYGVPYYWTAKDAGAMSQLLKKIAFLVHEKNPEEASETVRLETLGRLLAAIKSGWVYENLSVSILNSKFNEIVSQIKTQHNEPTTYSGKSENAQSGTRRTAGGSDAEIRRRERDCFESSADGILQGYQTPEFARYLRERQLLDGRTET